jgi:hypothetical protein
MTTTATTATRAHMRAYGFHDDPTSLPFDLAPDPNVVDDKTQRACCLEADSHTECAANPLLP